jgi:hypothetical protein
MPSRSDYGNQESSTTDSRRDRAAHRFASQLKPNPRRTSKSFERAVHANKIALDDVDSFQIIVG